MLKTNRIYQMHECMIPFLYGFVSHYYMTPTLNVGVKLRPFIISYSPILSLTELNSIK